MGFEVKIIADSLAPCGKRLTTMTWKYPRFVHSEVLTHRDRERNAASSRAIPWPRMMQAILTGPVIPIRWGSEQKGMQTGGEIDNPDAATEIWLKAMTNAVQSAQALAKLGVHKSLCNRLTEPFMWITVVMTATEWKNLFRLRCHPDAEIHFETIANMARAALESSKPTPLITGAWHLPFIRVDDWSDQLHLEDLKKISVARCARVSYLTHEGIRSPGKDLDLFQTLSQGSGYGHYSPFGHVAQACDKPIRSGPFIGWHQYRKDFPLENVEG